MLNVALFLKYPNHTTIVNGGNDIVIETE